MYYFGLEYVYKYSLKKNEITIEKPDIGLSEKFYFLNSV